MAQDNSSLSILCDNLRELDSRKGLAEEQRQICLSLLVSELINNSQDKSAEDIYKAFCRIIPHASGNDKIFLCRELIKKQSLIDQELSESILSFAENTAAGSHGKIAYVRNRYNDIAFSIFAESVSNAKPVVASSFAGSCEEVLDSRAEFCIIPIEDSVDGKLFGFYSMLDRYDLKIVSVCELENEERGKSVRYALVGKGLDRKSFAAIAKKRPLCSFEFSIISPDALFVSELISSADASSALPTTTDSLPVEYDDKLRRFFFTLDIRPADLYPLCLYLALEHSSYTFIGFYTK